jgi:hypothetical protein
MAKPKDPFTTLTEKKQPTAAISNIKKDEPGFPKIHPVIGVLKISKKAKPVSKKMPVLSKKHGRAEKDFTKDIRDNDMSKTGAGDEMDIPSTVDDTRINYGIGEDKNNYSGDDHGE